jgi:hypothetical protein
MIHTQRMRWLSKPYQLPAEELPVDMETKVLLMQWSMQ